ncbi:MAG: hypothetical protein KAX51_01995 [Chromatiaceae bacterium]|nr:hypothetical protein [Chromatiaceae bacterium]MBP8288582.1 hypothetical protein [Chromatiaceae bacterium]
MGRYLRAMARTGQPPGTSRKGCGLLAAPLPCQDLQAAPVGRYLRATPQAIRTDRASLPGVRATDRSPGQRWTRARDASRPSHVRTRPAIAPELRAEMIFAHRRDQASDQRLTRRWCGAVYKKRLPQQNSSRMNSRGQLLSPLNSQIALEWPLELATLPLELA